MLPDPVSIAELENEIELPLEMADIWQQFVQLDVRRNFNEAGPVRFSWSDLRDYQSVTGERLGRWALRTIFAVEDAYFVVRAENKT